MSTSEENVPFPLNQSMFDALFGEGRIGFFSNQQLGALSGTCSSLNDALFLELRKRKLLQHIVFGEQEKAETMIKANPGLLLAKSQAVDYSGRTIIATPFQAALGAEDERMWKMMKSYFDKLEELGKIKSARDELKRQFDEQFPEGIESTPASELQAMYNDLATAIIDNDDNGQAAIEAFRIYITEHNKVESGKHFNMQHLIAAYQVYLDNFNRLDTWDNRSTFWKKGIGFVQRQMPANYAQAHCSGIQNVLDKDDNFKRKLSFDFGKKVFFPLVDSEPSLGFDFALYSEFFALSGRLAGWRSIGPVRISCLNYVEQKQGHLSKLSESLSHQPKSCMFAGN